jgi:Family of unknown function (DUF6112)
MFLPSIVAVRLVGDPGVSPNTTGLPGVNEAKQIVGALLTFGLIGSVGGLAVSALMWAVSAHNGNSYYASRGKVGVLVAAGAAVLLGGADALITFFEGAGAAL